MARTPLALIIGALVIAACSGPTEGSPEPSDTAPTPPTAASSPSPEPSPRYPDAYLETAWEAETVFDWTTDRCADTQIPDLATRAIRDASGRVLVFLSHTEAFAMTGDSVDGAVLDCTPRFASLHSAVPSDVADAEWIASPYTTDGTTVFALIHNEYQGHQHPGMCPEADYFPCWDNSITLAVSTDGGESFSRAGADGSNLVARLPYDYEHGAGPMGYRAPSNIILGPDDYYYAYFNVSDYRTQAQWVCAMRTDQLDDPASWRYWENGNFTGVFLNPWVDEIPDPAEATCPPFEQDDIGHALGESVTWNEHVGRYLMVGLSADTINGVERWGVYYSFSDDLIDWDRRTLLQEVPLPWTVANGGSDESYLYPSVLDPASVSVNFSTSGENFYVYLTRNNHGHASLDRDLVRYAVTVVRGDPA